MINAFSHFLSQSLRIGVCRMAGEGNTRSMRGKFTADFEIQDISEEIYGDCGKASNKWPCDSWKDPDFETDPSLGQIH